MKPEEIEKLYKMSGLTQEEFASLFDRTAKTLQHYIKGSHFPTAQTIEKLEGLQERFGYEKTPKKISGPVLKKDGIVLNEDEIAMFFAENQESFLQHKIIRNIIDMIVAKKLLVLTSDRDKFMEFLKG